VLTDSKYNPEWKGNAPSLGIVPYKISDGTLLLDFISFYLNTEPSTSAPTPRPRRQPPVPKYTDYIPLFNQARRRARWRKSQLRRRVFVRVPPVFKPIVNGLFWVHDNTNCDPRKVFAVWVLVLAVIIFMELWRLLRWLIL
jgi:hypothetical protein